MTVFHCRINEGRRYSTGILEMMESMLDDAIKAIAQMF